MLVMATNPKKTIGDCRLFGGQLTSSNNQSKFNSIVGNSTSTSISLFLVLMDKSVGMMMKNMAEELAL